MKATLKFEVTADDGSQETYLDVGWCKCDWADVTAIQDVILSLSEKFTDLGYVMAQEKGLATPEQVEITKRIARGNAGKEPVKAEPVKAK